MDEIKEITKCPECRVKHMDGYLNRDHFGKDTVYICDTCEYCEDVEDFNERFNAPYEVQIL